MVEMRPSEDVVMSEREITLCSDINIGFLNLDKVNHILLLAKHPRHGELLFHINPEVAVRLRDWLNLNFPVERTTQ